jgi:hypothetical protein
MSGFLLRIADTTSEETFLQELEHSGVLVETRLLDEPKDLLMKLRWDAERLRDTTHHIPLKGSR